MKRFIRILISAVIVLGLAFSVCACNIDRDYFAAVTAYSFWDNEGGQSIPQYQFYNIMDEFLSEGQIQDGNEITTEGRVRKVAFLGFDGMRADALANIMLDATDSDTNGDNYQAEYSGIALLKSQGGLYLAYAGGEKGEDSEQSTSTSAGWTTELTGIWNTGHGIKDNDDIKNMDYDTIMLKYAKAGLDTSMSFDWDQYFDLNLKNEVKYLMDHPSINARYTDIDRLPVSSLEGLDTYAESVEAYNYLAVPKLSEYNPYDPAMRDYILDRIEEGYDFVAGIFHGPDSNGHLSGFSNSNKDYVNAARNSDIYAYQIIQAIEEREMLYNEEWLIIITADHGGYGKGHGKQYPEAKTIWIACNMPIDSKYFGIGYDGYKENA